MDQPIDGYRFQGSLSNGNTYPAIAVPWGMNFWMPQTGNMGNGWAYTYSSDKIRGFKQTHQPSPWMNDLWSVCHHACSPDRLNSNRMTGPAGSPTKLRLPKPYYYSVYLADWDVTTEIAPTERAAQFRFTFPQNDSSFVVIDALDRGSYVKVIPVRIRS